jgi:predicted small lipoprotein YifL
MKHSYGSALAAVLLASAAATGCGLKGALTMPSKSAEVVIRAPARAAPAEGETTPPPPAVPAEPAQATPTKKPPKAERIPPPPLPGGNPGTARGG